MISSLTFEHSENKAGAHTRVSMLILFSVVLFTISTAVQAAKTLKLGVRSDAPPFSSKFDNGNFDGYTVKLCELIATEAINRRLFDHYEFVEVTAANRFVFLRDGKIDLLCGASTMTLERMRIADFTFMTFLSGASVMYNKTSIEQEVNKDNCSLIVGVLGNTTTHDEVERIMGKFEGHETLTNCVIKPPKDLDHHIEGFRQLKAGKINAYVADREILLALENRPGKMADESKEAQPQEIEVSTNYFSYEPYAIAVNRENRELRLLANEVLSRLFAWRNARSGDTIATVLSRYFPRKKFSKDLEYMFRLQQIQQGVRITD